MEKGNLKHGVRAFLPTLISDNDRNILSALKLIEAAMDTGSLPTIKGMHLEGRYISVPYHGAHDPSLIRPLDQKMLNVLCGFGIKGVLKLITIAPETVSPDQIRKLVESNIVVSMGHSGASTNLISMFILEEAVSMCSSIPALAANIDTGKPAKGKPADSNIFNLHQSDNHTRLNTFADGKKA
jgi:N-acetylglucosamine-6-phosphate deacetylase